MEGFTIRRRNKLRHHYTITSNVLLYGYHHVSDGAKQTYQLVDSMDWTDATGQRKGYAYPPLMRIAMARGMEKRTIRRHIAELESVKLITRDERPGRPSFLIIEDPSDEETQRYLSQFAGPGEDKIVLPTPDKHVRPYKKEETEEKQNLVNEEQALSGVGEPAIAPMSHEAKAKREYLAQEILSVLHDEKSLGFYRRVAATVEPQHIFEALSEVRLANREGRIRTNRGAYFTTLIKSGAYPAQTGEQNG